jgi:TolA-binding protein
MDCEKFESTLIDELYEELDEVTSAAAKRHAGGCARCAARLAGLKATRRLAVLPIVEPPAELEARILAVARDAQHVAPFGRRVSRAVSWAGSWAMRPQTAMAALFLLMIGSSALLLRGKQAATPRSAMTVSERGEPVPSATTGTLERPAGEAADKASPIAAPSLSPTPAGQTVASTVGDLKAEPPAAHGARRLNLPSKSGRDDSPKSLAYEDDLDRGGEVESRKQHYALPPPAAGGAGGAGATLETAMRAAPAAAPAQPVAKADAPGADQDAARTAFKSGDYGTATTLFDARAATGDKEAALWAARSVREGQGCAAAVSRFDDVARDAAGTKTGYDATFEGGQCYRQLGQIDAAQSRFRSLITVPSYVDQAKRELAQLAPRPAAKARPSAATAPAGSPQPSTAKP